jgi:hypothetical protein
MKFKVGLGCFFWIYSGRIFGKPVDVMVILVLQTCFTSLEQVTNLPVNIFEF